LECIAEYSENNFNNDLSSINFFEPLYACYPIPYMSEVETYMGVGWLAITTASVSTVSVVE
jgi:hypothetical protein